MQVGWDSTGSIEGIFGSGSRHEDQGLPPESLARKLVKAYLDHDHIRYLLLLPSSVIDTVDRIYHKPSFYKSNPFKAFVFDMVLAISTANVFKFDWQILPSPESHHTRAMSAVTYSPSDRPDSAIRRLTNVHRNAQPSLPKTSLYGKDFQLLLLNLTRPSQGQYLDCISFQSINPPKNPKVLRKKFSEKNIPPSGGATPR